jgi:hypothetical protein
MLYCLAMADRCSPGDRTRNVVGRLIRLVMDTMFLPTVCIIGVTVMYLVYVS